MKADCTVTRLPKLTNETLDAIMSERLFATKSDATSIPILWQGLLEMIIPVGQTERTAKLYIPKDTPQCTAFVLLNVPEGMDTVSFLHESGWIRCADRYQLPIFAAEPASGGWKQPNEEQSYIEACVAALFAGIYMRAGMSSYVVGYGATGKCLHQYVMNTPLRVAAAVFSDASDLEKNVIAEAEAASLNGSSMTFDIRKKDIPVPVWIIEKKLGVQAKSAIDHWKQTICAGEPTEDSILGKVYRQTRDSVCTPGGCIAQVCVKESAVSPAVDDICAFLLRYARYNKFGPYGNSLVPHVDYDKSGVEVRRFADPDGNLRECLVYVPKGFNGKIPMLLAIHGFSESVRNYFEESLWYDIAEKEGFIVVIPETTLYFVPQELSGGIPMAYRPRWRYCSSRCIDPRGLVEKDIAYIDSILDAVIRDYPVDEGRIYCTGHSNGYMMVNLLASSPIGSRIAAVAATSGITSVWDETGTDRIPVFFTMGEYDLWPYGIQEETNMTRGIDLWLVRNGLATAENAKQIRISGASETFTAGRHHCMQWNDKNGIPMIRYDWIEKKDHMNTPEENRMFWRQWFSKWILDKGKGRCYEGKPI